MGKGWGDAWRNYKPPTAMTMQTAKPSKYRNIETTVDGITFKSAKEAKRYQELRLLERAGEIRGLECQRRYPLFSWDGDEGKREVCVYVADFDYLDKRGAPVTEDSKGVRTKDYRIKAKMFAANYGRAIVET
jgi:hypothetical protein